MCIGVNVKTFNDNMNELHVIDRRGMRSGKVSPPNYWMRKTQFYVRTSRSGLESGVTALSKKAMGMMYSKDWVTLSDTLATLEFWVVGLTTERTTTLPKGTVGEA
jgi:hypothetical protein